MKTHMLLVVISGYLGTIWCAPDNHFSLEWAMLIQQRSYGIKRLEQPWLYLRQALKHVSIIHSHDNNLTYLSYWHHPVIKKTLQEIIQMHDIAPIYELWDHYYSYKYIDDDLFNRECVLFLLIMYTNIIINVNNYQLLVHDIQQKTHPMHHNNLFVLPIEFQQPFSLADKAAPLDEHIIKHHIDTFISLLERGPHDLNVIIGNTTRYYHIRRLIKPFSLLAKFYPETYILSKEIVQKFENSLIQECCQNIHDKKNIGPLFAVWHQFIAHEFLMEEKTIREFICLMIVLYYIWLGNQTIQKSCNDRAFPSEQDIAHVYDHIVALPLPTLLNILDDSAEQLNYLAHTYELYNDSLTWSDWFKKYWWVPPVALLSVLSIWLKYTKVHPPQPC